MRDDLEVLIIPTHHCCNASYAKDEEYVVLSLGPTALGSPAGRELFKDIRRRYLRPDGRGRSLYHMVLGEFERRPGGLQLPYGLAFKAFDRARVHRVMRKIVRGLFSHHVGRFLPDNTPQHFDLFGRPQDLPQPVQDIIDLPLKVHGPDESVFAYRFSEVPNEDMSFQWWWWDILLWGSVLAILPFHDPACPCETCIEARNSTCSGGNGSGGYAPE